MDWRSRRHRSARTQLSSAANCARCKYRLTPRGTDGRSNRQRFTNEQRGRWCRRRKAWRCGGCLLPYGIALPLAGPVRSDRSRTPQLATVILADGAVNQVPEPSALRDLVPPPEGMTVIRMEIARSRRDGAASSPCAPHSIGRLQRAMARNLAIQLQLPTWHLCWTSLAAMALSAGASPPSLVCVGSAQDRS